MTVRSIILATFVALGLAACNEPARPDATMVVTAKGPDGVARRATYDARFALLTGCGTMQRLQVNATGLPDRAALTFALSGDRARLETAAFRAGELGFSEAFNGWYNGPSGSVQRKHLDNNQQELRIDLRAKGDGVWGGPLDRMPDLAVTVDGTFEKIAAYGPGGKTPCPTGGSQ